MVFRSKRIWKDWGKFLLWDFQREMQAIDGSVIMERNSDRPSVEAQPLIGNEAWVLETAGKYWVAKRVEDVC